MPHSEINEGALTPRLLARPAQRRVDSLGPQLSLGVASARESAATPGHSALICGACRASAVAISVWADEEVEKGQLFTTSLINDKEDIESAVRSLSQRLPRLLVVADTDVVWWSASQETDDLVAIINAEGDVHVLSSAGEDVRSEVLEPGDRIAVLSEGLVSDLYDPRLVLEMALVDDPQPSSSVEWILAAALDDGGSDHNLVAIWRTPEFE
jgi:hypothetical protein